MTAHPRGGRVSARSRQRHRVAHELDTLGNDLLVDFVVPGLGRDTVGPAFGTQDLKGGVEEGFELGRGVAPVTNG